MNRNVVLAALLLAGSACQSLRAAIGLHSSAPSSSSPTASAAPTDPSSPQVTTVATPGGPAPAVHVKFPDNHFAAEWGPDGNGGLEGTLNLTVEVDRAYRGKVSLRLIGEGKEMKQNLERDFCLGVGSNIYLDASPCGFKLGKLTAGTYEIQTLLDGKVAASRTIHLKEVFSFATGKLGLNFKPDTARAGRRGLILDPAFHGEKLTIDPDGEDATLFLTMNAAQASASVALVWLDGNNVVTVSQPQELKAPTLGKDGPVQQVVPIVFRNIPKVKAGMRAVVRMEHQVSGKTVPAIFEVTDAVMKSLSTFDYATMSKTASDERSEPAKLALAAVRSHSMGPTAEWENESTVCGVIEDENARLLVASYVFAQASGEAAHAISRARDEESRDLGRSRDERESAKGASQVTAAWSEKDLKDAAKLGVKVKALRKKFRGDCLRG